MSPSSLVSVIMPVYNERREYLELAVASILRQTHTNIEFLIMDDGSGPETAAALDAVARRDERIRLFRQDNAGLTVSLNRLIRQARGAFIARQDSDDLSEPERFEQQVSFLFAHPELKLLGTACLLIDPRGKVLHRQRILTHPETLRHRMRCNNQFAHGSVMFRSEIFKVEGLYYEEYRYAEDYDLFLRISERHMVANLALPLYRYRINPESISVAKSHQQILMGMVAREAGKLRRKGQEIKWSEETYDRIAASLNTPRHQRRLECLVCAGQGRNLLLAGNKQEARQAFWRAFSLSPSPKRLWHLLRSLMPWRWVR